MRKYRVLLLTVVVFASLAFAAYAGHVPMLYPYDSILYGYESTMPIPEGGDLRHHITSHSPYKKEFTIFPGTTTMFEGTEPHGAYITVYVNDIALKSVNDKEYSNNNISIRSICSNLSRSYSNLRNVFKKR